MTGSRSAHAAALLTVAEMARADAAAIAAGVPGEALMESAGGAVANEILARWSRRETVVLCGPGNNGGDGFVVARRLREAGWPVRVALYGDKATLPGDAAGAASRWGGPVEPLGEGLPDGDPLVVDALFGAGLARPVEGAARRTIEAANARGLVCVGVDVPSGVHGDSGLVLGAAVRCALTVTFFRRKPGHLLLPGRVLAGRVVVADIGIRENVLDDIRPRTHENGPALWLDRFPWPRAEDHKYSRGHAVVVGGAVMTGAGRLAARAARRVGAGLVTVAAPPTAVALYAGDAPGVLISVLGDAADFAALLADARRNAVLIGPGNGASAATRERALAALAAGKACVLDADALTVFAADPQALFAAVRSPCLLTPHEGEFRRLFPAVGAAGGKVERARQAARESRATMLLKGADSVIADPGGGARINANAPPDLATAGSGDVLAGLATGLLAQGMGAFDAASAAAWLQGATATEIGPGLIAEDLPAALPAVLRRLRDEAAGRMSGAAP